MDPIKSVEVPYVTFEPQDQRVLMAVEFYTLDDDQVATVKQAESCGEDKAVKQTQGDEEVKGKEAKVQTKLSPEQLRIAAAAGMSPEVFLEACAVQWLYKQYGWR